MTTAPDDMPPELEALMHPPVQREETIDGTRYRLTLLPPKRGLYVIRRFGVTFGTLMLHYGDLTKVGAAFATMRDEDVDYLCAAYCECTEIANGPDLDKIPEALRWTRLTPEHFDSHFRGRLLSVFKWLAAVTIHNFFGFLLVTLHESSAAQQLTPGMASSLRSPKTPPVKSKR